jgi:hypothetical protein
MRILAHPAFALLHKTLDDAGMPKDQLAASLQDLAVNGTGGQGVLNILNWIVANAPAIFAFVSQLIAVLSAAGL